MSTGSSISESFRNKLKDQVEQLSSLHLEDSSSLESQDFHLESIFQKLFNEYYHNSELFKQIKLAELEKLTELSLRVLEAPDSHEPVGNLPKVRCKLWALKILILVVLLLTHQLHNEKLLRMIYDSLTKKLQVPDEEVDPIDELLQVKKMSLIGLSAYCLSELGFENILSSEEASTAITGRVLPLAVFCLTREVKHKAQNACRQFEQDFHGLYNRVFIDREILTNDSFSTYPLVVFLLLALMRRSESGPRGQRKQFELMLSKAVEGGKVTNEDVVAVNILVADYVASRDSNNLIKHLDKLLIDVLIKSEGLHRAHVAFLSWKFFENSKNVHAKESRRSFVGVMFDDLVTKDDELLYEVAIRSIWSLWHGIQDWSEIFSGREHLLMRKLSEKNANPAVYFKFVTCFKPIEDAHSAVFDDLTLEPISKAIDDLLEKINSKKRGPDDLPVIHLNLECIGSFLKLRRHRLGQQQESRLNQALELISVDEVLRKCHSVKDGISLVFVNNYQVHPSAWQSILESIRFVKPVRLPTDRQDVLHCQLMIELVFPHLLIIDTDRFYNELGSLELLESIYKYCERAIDGMTKLPLGSIRSLLTESMVTWPRDSEGTKLDSKEHQELLHRFIELIVDKLEEARKNVLSKEHPEIREKEKMTELLFALVAAFSLHHDVLKNVLKKLESESKLNDMDLWLQDNISNWIKLVIDNGKQHSTYEYYTYALAVIRLNQFPDRLASLENVVVAYEGFRFISSDSHSYSNLRESSGPLLKVVAEALERGIKRAPVDSLESKKYRLMRARLPTNQNAS